MALKQGSKGENVTSLQNRLGKLGFAIKADGEFGADTKAAVEDVQSMFGYTVDGIVGDGTNGLIDKQLEYGWALTNPDAIEKGLKAQGKTTEKGSLAGPELTRNLKNGTEGADVRYLQHRLNSFGYGIKADGKFGPETQKTVKALQEAFGYTVDGIVGEGTNKLINAQIGHGWNINKPRA